MPDLVAYSALTDEWSETGDLLEMVTRRPAWQADALCREYPEVTWFPGKGDDLRPARVVCTRCLVADECLTWAVDQGPQLEGIWAGTSPRKRRQIRVSPGTGRAA